MLLPVVIAVPENAPTHTLSVPSVILLSSYATDAGIVLAGGVVEQRSIANGRVAVLGRVAPERKNTDSRVCDAGGVIMQCSPTDARVVASGRVAIESLITIGRVADAGGVGEERGHSSGRVGVAGGVEEERYSADCGIGIPRVKGQRSSTNSGIEVGVCAAKERIPTNCRVRRAGGEALKGIGSLLP